MILVFEKILNQAETMLKPTDKFRKKVKFLEKMAEISSFRNKLPKYQGFG